MDLARQFDVRFIHMHDRWDTEKFPPRPPIEEMKARYYGILAALDKVSIPCLNMCYVSNLLTRIGSNLSCLEFHIMLRRQEFRSQIVKMRLSNN